MDFIPVYKKDGTLKSKYTIYFKEHSSNLQGDHDINCFDGDIFRKLQGFIFFYDSYSFWIGGGIAINSQTN